MVLRINHGRMPLQFVLNAMFLWSVGKGDSHTDNDIDSNEVATDGIINATSAHYLYYYYENAGHWRSHALERHPALV